MRVTLVVLAVLSAAPAAAAPRPVTVFLERNGQTVERRNGDEVRIPRFGGGDRAWNAMVSCVKEQFAPFQIEIVERRPAGSDHITALVGGKASMIGMSDRTTAGIGPYDGSVLRGALVHVFSQVGPGERDHAGLCAVTAHEVGHALGLDHTYKCGDVMSYFNDECGPQTFLDVDMPCGESEERTCATGDETQNSYRRLASLVGLKRAATAPEPMPEPMPALDDDDLDTSGDPWDGPAFAPEAYDDDAEYFDDNDSTPVQADDAVEAREVEEVDDTEDTQQPVRTHECEGASSRQPRWTEPAPRRGRFDRGYRGRWRSR
jgi:hypothetical protein